MDKTQREDHQKQKLQKNKFMRRSLQFVISVCVFSFFVWYSSGFSILHRQFLNVYFSTFLFSFITHTLERKYMFLICNVILAFLAKTSSTTSSSPSSSSSSSSLSSISPTVNLQLQDHASRFEEEEEVEQIKQPEDREGEELLESPEEEEEEGRDYHDDGALCTQMVEEGGGGGEIETFDSTTTDEEAEEGGIGISDMMMVGSQEDDATTTATNEELVNTEDMNRKFEEFIRKMKEEMRIQARRQLIAV